MAEPWEERVAVAIVTNLEGIVGGNSYEISAEGYWYTPIVERCRTTEMDGLLTDEVPPIRETIIALAPAEIEITEVMAEEVNETIVINFMLARRHPKSDEPYHQALPTPWQVQNRLWHDFKKKTLDDVQLGGLVDNTNFRNVTLSAEFTWVHGWAAVIGQLAPTKILAKAEF